MIPNPRQPTALEAEQAAVVQVEVLELFAKLEREGVSWQVALTGAATAIANVVMQQVGPAEVPVWFARTAALTMHLGEAEPNPAPKHDPR